MQEPTAVRTEERSSEPQLMRQRQVRVDLTFKTDGGILPTAPASTASAAATSSRPFPDQVHRRCQELRPATLFHVQGSSEKRLTGNGEKLTSISCKTFL